MMAGQMPNLSGGELQRVALVVALGLGADIYLIDEPSAYLDAEQRIVAAKVIKRSAGACGGTSVLAVAVGQAACACASCASRLSLCISGCIYHWHVHIASSFTPRRQPSSSSTTSSWLPTLPTASSFTRASPQRTA